MLATEPGALPTTVLHTLVDGSCQTIDYLVAHLGLTRRQVSDGAAKLVFRGYLERIEAGCYRLTETGLAAAQAGETITSGPFRPHSQKAPKALADTFRQRLWTAMRMSGAFTLGDLVMAASRGDNDPENNAAWYVRHLRNAGYVTELPTRQKGTRLTSTGFKRFRLLKDTGMVAPVYRPKTRTVFDHNTGEDVPCKSR